MLATLLIGWGVGWFVARSKVTEPVRLLLVTRRDAQDALWRPALAAGVRPDRIDVLSVIATSFFAGVTSCAACFGFWAGCALGLVTPIVGSGFAGVLATGVAVMGANAVLDAFTGASAAREQEAWRAIDVDEEYRRTAQKIAGAARPCGTEEPN